MFDFDLIQIAEKTGGRLIGENLSVSAVAIDSRKLSNGSLFVAIKGENHNGAEFVGAAADKGAVAALVEKQLDINLPQIIVADTKLALAALANMVRSASDASFIAVTGSNGKTTVKEMIRAILAEVAPVHATEGNLNNEIGVPLTMFALQDEHKYAVIEMGASKQGDISYLTKIANPHISVVTNASAAHLQGFGDIDGVAKTKGEIFASLQENGLAVINADDKYAGYWKDIAGTENIITFGECATADIRLGEQTESGVEIETPNGELVLKLKLPGLHNIKNALAATGVAVALNIPLTTIKIALEKMGAVKGRLCFESAKAGGVVIDDSYNANPASLKAGLQVLAEQSGEKWLLLGDMAELGDGAQKLHAEAAEYARNLGVSKLFACGNNSEIVVKNFGAGAQVISDTKILIEELNKNLVKGVTLLVKGSRMMQLDKVVQAVKAGGQH